VPNKIREYAWREWGRLFPRAAQDARDLAARHAIIVAVALGFLAVYGHLHPSYVGGCDDLAYFTESLRIRGKDAGMRMSIDPQAYPAVVPSGHVAAGREIVSLFPAGFSFLLALGGTLGLEFWVAPFFGALCVLLVYCAALRETNRWVAVVLAILFGLVPEVFNWSRDVMSDVPATAFALLTYILTVRGYPALAGAALGFSCGIRPTNLLMLPTILLLLGPQRPREALRLGGAFLVVGAYWVVFNLATFGAAFGTPYAHMDSKLLSLRALAFQPASFAQMVARSCWPEALLAAVAVKRSPTRHWPELVWFLTFFAFYSLWNYHLSGPNALRFLLPGLPALFILAARGYQAASEHRTLARTAPWALAGLSLGGVLSSVRILREWIPDYANEGTWFRDVSLRVKDTVPPDSLIGATDFSGPLRYYAQIETFRWPRLEPFALIEAMVARGRWTYLLVEDGLPPNRYLARNLHERFDIEPVAEYGTYLGTRLERLIPRRSGPAPDLPAVPFARVVEAVGGTGSPALVLDGRAPEKGTRLDAADALVLKGNDSYLTLRLSPGHFDALRVSADAESEYVVEGSENGSRFAVLGSLPAATGSGLAVRDLLIPGKRAWPFLRIRPHGGKARHALAEVAFVSTSDIDIDLGRRDAESSLLDGWAELEGAGTSDAFVWAASVEASLRGRLTPGIDHELLLSVSPFHVKDRAQTVEVECNGDRLGTLTLKPDWQEARIVLPASSIRAETRIVLRFGYALSPEGQGLGPDPRTLAAAFRRIVIRRADPAEQR
jgi:hypothetical protein